MTATPRGWTEAPCSVVAPSVTGKARVPGGSQPGRSITFKGLVEGGSFRPSEVVDAATAAEKAMTLLRCDDIVFTKQGHVQGWIAKKVGRVRAEQSGMYAASTLHVLRPSPAVVPQLLEYWFRWASTYEQLADIAGARTALTKSMLDDLMVPVPPLAEQQRIVAAIEEHLSHLDSAQTSVARAHRSLGPLRRSVLSQANDPVYEEALVGDLLTNIEAGKSLKSPGGHARMDQWGVIKVSAMTWGVFAEGEHKVVPDDLVDPSYEIVPGDLLFSRANTSQLVGASVLVERTRPRLLLSDKSMRLHVRPDVEKRWLHAALSSPAVREQISAVATGTSDSMRNISQEKLRQLRVHVPPLDEQRRLAESIREQLSAVERMEADLGTAQNRATALRRAVLAAAFSGQLVDQDDADEPASTLLESIRNAAAPTHRSVRPGREPA
jgi:type I restriction enzyme S subunit